MGISSVVTRVACNTSTGNQAITVSVGSISPKAAIFIVTNAATDGTASTDVVWSFGAATGTSNEWAIAVASEDGQSTTDTYNGWTSSYCIKILNASDGSVDGTAEFVSFSSNTVTINWTDAPSSAYLLTVIALAGTDLSAYAGNSGGLGNSASTTTDITSIGFEPVDVLCGLSRQAAVDSVGAQAYHSLGMVHYDGVSTYTQRCIASNWRDGRATSEAGGFGRNDACIAQTLTSATLDWYGVASDFDSSGFSITTENAGGNLQTMCFLALAYNDAVDSWVGDHTTPTSTGNDGETGPSMTPQLVFSIQSLIEAYATQYSANRMGSFGVSVFDDTNEYAISVQHEQGVGTSNTQSLSDDTAVQLPDDDGTALLTAAFVSMDANGWTNNYSAVHSSAVYFPTWVLEAEAGGTTYNMSATLTATSTTPDTVVAAIDREMSATATATSTTTDTSIFGLGFDFAATMTAASTTPDTVALAFLIELAATLTAASTTPDIVPLAISRALSATATATSTTPDTVALAVSREMLATLTAASTTPDTVTLATLRDLAATMTAASATPDTITLAFLIELAATLTAASTTPDTVALAIARELAAIMTGASTTTDTSVLVIARELAATLTAASTTPDTVVLSVEALLELAAVMTAASTTPDTITLATLRDLAATLTAISTTTDTSVFAVARDFAATMTAASTTPDTVVLSIEGFLELAATITAVSTTTDTSSLAVARALSATLTAASTTPDTVTLSIAGLIELAATITAASTTPDTVALAIARTLSATLTAASTTPDTVTIAVLRSTLASMAAASTTPDTVTIAIERLLAATATAASTTPDTAEITQIMLWAASILAASTTPDNATLTVAAIQGLITVTWTLRQPGVSFSSDQPIITWTSRQPSISYSSDQPIVTFSSKQPTITFTD